jgi:hypothetical protein
VFSFAGEGVDFSGRFMVFVGDDEGRDWVVVIYLRYEDGLKENGEDGSQ